MGKKKIQGRWRYRGFSALLMVLVIVLAVAVSLAAALLEKKNDWRLDLSFNSISTPEESTLALLEGLSHPVHIYLLTTRSTVDEDLTALLNRYAAFTDKITWELAIPSENPVLVQKYTDAGLTDLSENPNTMIITCQATGRESILTPYDYLTVEYSIDLEGYEYRHQYEKALAQGLLHATMEAPVVMILRATYNNMLGDMKLFTSFLDENLYYPVEVDLLAGGSLENCSLLVIPALDRDLREAEIAAINAYLAKGGSLLTFHDPQGDGVSTPNYNTLLAYYGIHPLSGTVYAKSEANYLYSEDRAGLIPMLSTTLFGEDGATLSSQMMFPYSGGFELREELDSALETQGVAVSGQETYLRRWSGDSASIEFQEGDQEGPVALAVFSRRFHESGAVSRVLSLGTSGLFYNEDMLYQTKNGFFLQTMMAQLLPTDYSDLLLSIESKPYYRPMLSTRAKGMGTAIIIGLPLLVALGACLILVPRRHM